MCMWVHIGCLVSAMRSWACFRYHFASICPGAAGSPTGERAANDGGASTLKTHAIGSEDVVWKYTRLQGECGIAWFLFERLA